MLSGLGSAGFHNYNKNGKGKKGTKFEFGRQNLSKKPGKKERQKEGVARTSFACLKKILNKLVDLTWMAKHWHCFEIDHDKYQLFTWSHLASTSVNPSFCYQTIFLGSFFYTSCLPLQQFLIFPRCRIVLTMKQNNLNFNAANINICNKKIGYLVREQLFKVK
jgi:hypothetical protein